MTLSQRPNQWIDVPSGTVGQLIAANEGMTRVSDHVLRDEELMKTVHTGGDQLRYALISGVRPLYDLLYIAIRDAAAEDSDSFFLDGMAIKTSDRVKGDLSNPLCIYRDSFYRTVVIEPVPLHTKIIRRQEPRWCTARWSSDVWPVEIVGAESFGGVTPSFLNTYYSTQ